MPSFNQAALEAELARDEGRRTTPYKDSRGFLTVGIGHNLAAGPLPGQAYPMTAPQIDALFASDVAATVAKLDTYLSWWRQLDDPRQRVLLNMCFNLGIGRPGKGDGLLAFGTFLGFVRSGQYGEAADDMLKTLWARQVGARATRLAAVMRGASFIQPAPVVATPKTVKAALKDAGSVTINAADMQTKILTAGGSAVAGVTLLNQLTDALKEVPPWAWGALLLVGIAAVYLYTHRIVLARIETAITGVNTDVPIVAPSAPAIAPPEPDLGPAAAGTPEPAAAAPDAAGGAEQAVPATAGTQLVGETH